jgi:NitT/TauT family transport system permease protein
MMGSGGIRRFLTSYWGILGLLVAWQAWVFVSGVNEIVVPKPKDVVLDVVLNLGLYVSEAAQTLFLAVVGLFLGMFVGTALAVLAWLSRILSGILVPIGIILSSIPVVAMIPILARLFGYDVQTVMVIVIIISFFPAFVFTSAGLKALPPGSSDLFRVFGANKIRRFLYLVMPSAVPSWMIAFRLTAPPAVLVAMVAEFLMAQGGLGEMFRDSVADFQMSRAFGTSLVATIVSVLSFLGATWAEEKVKERWT